MASYKLELKETQTELRQLYSKYYWLSDLLTKAKIENRNLKEEIEELRNQLFKQK